MIKRINHVGIAVNDLNEAIEFFLKAYGARLVWRIKFDDQKIESALLAVGEARFELTASLEPQSVIANFIETRGEGLHHISMEVSDFDKAINALKANGMRVMAEAETEDFSAAFVHPKSNYGILMEIIEPKKDENSWRGSRGS